MQKNETHQINDWTVVSRAQRSISYSNRGSVKDKKHNANDSADQKPHATRLQAPQKRLI